MKFIYLFIQVFFLTIYSLQAQTSPKREMRAAWVATYANIDWPSSGSSSAVEQSTFIQRVDEHKATGINAIFVQVRSQADAMYPSPYEPWSADLTGTQGTAPNPYYDPMEFMINQTHQRGMEFHAWFNPYRAMATFNTTNYNNLSASHVVKAHPEWIMNVTTNSNSAQQRLLNPGAPEVWDHIIKVMMHVVRNYDVDGIHFDDYFYTNPALTTYNDDSVYAIHNRGIANRATWRRSNVDTLIRRLGDSIRSVKPWIKFGISPSGIWLSQANDPLNGSNTSAGATQHYKDLYANSRLWLQQGWIDYLAPQVYWYIGQTGSDYNILAPWWNNNNFGRHIYMGMAGYKVGDALQNAAFATDNTQIPRQVRLNRQLTGIQGQAVYNTTSLRNNKLNFRDSLRLHFFTKPALLPAMSWKDNSGPASATSLTASLQGDNTIKLNWTRPATAANEMDKAKQFVIYRSAGTAPDTNNIEHLVAITLTDTEEYIDTATLANGTYYYVVTALDRLHNESPVSNTASLVLGPLPLTLLQFDAWKTYDKSVQLLWKTSNEINTLHFEVERAINGNTFISIQNIKATSGSTSATYKTTDNSLLVNGLYYYRLKMTDKDGSFNYSKIKTIKVTDAGPTLVAYPTPVVAGNNLQLTLPGFNGKNVVRLVGSTGKVVMNSQVIFTAGNATLKIPGNIIPGTYILQCFDGNSSKQIQVLVQ
jgi:uncharacterized lipoprotein YddW (UPF0748 family)